MGNKTALYNKHAEMGAKLVDFGSWKMPLHYGSQIDEHHKVRQDAGMFDVSHMTIVDITGTDAKAYLRRLLANDVARLQLKGKALYTAMLNENAGVIDDLIVYLMTESGVAGEWFRVVLNSATRDKDLRWMSDQSAGFDVALAEQPELAMVAIQGPNALEKVKRVVNESRNQLIDKLKLFQGLESESWFIARTGYTGEDGLEIILPDDEVSDFWQALADNGVSPCGLGARDTLRLEAGMNLYGSDMDENISPLNANMGWTIAWEPAERDFIGRKALEEQRASGAKEKLVGLVLNSRGVLRSHQAVVIENMAEGIITSGTFSPTLGCAIAMARVPAGVQDKAEVVIRNKPTAVRIVKLPFVRNGKQQFD